MSRIPYCDILIMLPKHGSWGCVAQPALVTVPTCPSSRTANADVSLSDRLASHGCTLHSANLHTDLYTGVHNTQHHAAALPALFELRGTKLGIPCSNHPGKACTTSEVSFMPCSKETAQNNHVFTWVCSVHRHLRFVIQYPDVKPRVVTQPATQLRHASPHR